MAAYRPDASVEVARAWERAFFDPRLPATRRVALRMAIVLGDGSALTPLVNLARVGLGGSHLDGPWPGSRDKRDAGAHHVWRHTHGHQRFSWVHLDDVVRAVSFIAASDLEGVVTIAAPGTTDDASLMRALRRILGVPVGLPLPRPLLELGSVALRTEVELLLKSRWVVPERLEAAGFRFAFPEIEGALRDLLSRPPGR
ncbi:DUF1731 domain-containing protein [Galbitalea sp. SE-J8]|uniref:DUF1731 domain-containing protein n=1 Tax=Galbitalea sp. SE-J8 TaxID=3054952 RepID=UPI00259D0BCD|nr:DUF1731 domain-containing protein [Galbitalea sp. SE-J8]MDM4763099.1 DUF1731 domain-containing protein [Galbitalea sp. SE-J8]